MTQRTSCRLAVADHVAVVTIDRPAVLNALDPTAHRELDQVFSQLRDDDDVRVIILTGAGDRAFCVGTDLKALAATGDDFKPESGFAGLTHRFDLWKPVIAAVNGLCLGGGVEILAACDIAVASEHAQFGLPEPRVGLAALGGAALQRLIRYVPAKDAMWLALSGERIDAQRALGMHLVNEVVPGHRLMERAQEMARTILRGAPLSLQASKQVMLQSLAHAALPDAFSAPYPLAQRMLASQDAIEGPRAFAEKRQPRWTGR
jgi:enoyl-CoA hydratase/carnithine racemase